ncbi:MAG: HPr kinase/phosphorylase [Rhizobiaceae bacterium]
MTSTGSGAGAGVATNIHATMVVIGDRGVLIAGPSGSGKTSLALTLIERASARGAFARLVSDDQVLLAARGLRLVCTAPPSIAGLAERRGLGPAPANHVGAAVADLMVRLVPAADAPRVDPGGVVMVAGVELPVIALPERLAETAARAIEARLARRD